MPKHRPQLLSMSNTVRWILLVASCDIGKQGEYTDFSSWFTRGFDAITNDVSLQDVGNGKRLCDTDLRETDSIFIGTIDPNQNERDATLSLDFKTTENDEYVDLVMEGGE